MATDRWRVELNERLATELKLNEKKIAKIRSCYQKININKPTHEPLFLADLAILKGPLGQIAYVRNDSTWSEKYKKTLVIEFPLNLTAREQKSSLISISNFFKPLFTAQSEKVLKGASFSTVTKKPYRGYEMQEGEDFRKAAKSIFKTVRSKDYSQVRQPYGSVSTRNRDFLRKRNGWIKKCYSTLKDTVQGDFKAAEVVSEELKKLKDKNPFGQYALPKKDPFDLKPETILSIVRR